MHFLKQKLVHCGFEVQIPAELLFILRADLTSILLAFSVFTLTRCTTVLLSVNNLSESSAPKLS